jgi:hypothetical protein
MPYFQKLFQVPPKTSKTTYYDGGRKRRERERNVLYLSMLVIVKIT